MPYFKLTTRSIIMSACNQHSRLLMKSLILFVVRGLWRQAARTHTARLIQMSHISSPQQPWVARGFNNEQTALLSTQQLEQAFTK